MGRQALHAERRTNPQPTQRDATQDIGYGINPLASTLVVGEETAAALELGDPHTQPTTSPADTPTPIAPTLWEEPPPPIIFTDDASHPNPRLELLMHSIWQLHLRGYPADAIGRKVNISFNRVRKLLREIKATTMEYMVENPQVFGAPLELLYTQTLRRRERQSALWEELKNTTMESVRPQFYRLIAEEDKAIENLLGMNRETIGIVLGSPAQHASADILRQAGPDGLKEILSTIRDICVGTTGQLPALESTQTIQGSVRELKGPRETENDQEHD